MLTINAHNMRLIWADIQSKFSPDYALAILLPHINISSKMSKGHMPLLWRKFIHQGHPWRLPPIPAKKTILNTSLKTLFIRVYWRHFRSHLRKRFQQLYPKKVISEYIYAECIGKIFLQAYGRHFRSHFWTHF